MIWIYTIRNTDPVSKRQGPQHRTDAAHLHSAVRGATYQLLLSASTVQQQQQQQ